MTDPLAIPPVLYYFVIGIAFIGWGALIFFSRRHWANFWFAGVGVPLVLSMFYIYLLIVFWFQPAPAELSEFLSLGGDRGMFRNDGLLLVAIINVLSMNLFAGAWMARRAAQTHMPAVYLIPCLLSTVVFAGIGFTLFCVAMALGERWGAIAKLEKKAPLKRVVFPSVPAHEVAQ